MENLFKEQRLKFFNVNNNDDDNDDDNVDDDNDVDDYNDVDDHDDVDDDNDDNDIDDDNDRLRSCWRQQTGLQLITGMNLGGDLMKITLLHPVYEYM